MKKLTDCDFPDTKQIYVGYDLKSIPEATPENMVVLMEKINELIERVKRLEVRESTWR